MLASKEKMLSSHQNTQKSKRNEERVSSSDTVSDDMSPNPFEMADMSRTKSFKEPKKPLNQASDKKRFSSISNVPNLQMESPCFGNKPFK